jgi:succinylglutamate desuccinylase
VGARRTLLLAEFGDAHRPTISLSAGVHGDEPAAPCALLNIVESGLLDPRFAYRIWPCTNPSGYEAQTRANAEGQDINRSFSRGGLTPEAKAIITATRDRKFALSLDLHEDFEAEGCYCYEPLRDGDSFSSAIIEALDDNGCPVQEILSTFDLGYSADAKHVCSLRRGRVMTNLREEIKHFAGLPYSIYIARQAANRALTFESPRRRQFSERVAMHRIAVTAAIAALLKVSPAGAQKIR